jgi:hypothetical protein
MSSTAGSEGVVVQEQPRLQRKALNLFETISATLANLAPAEGIFLSIGLVVAVMGSRAPWAFLIAMVAVLTLGNTRQSSVDYDPAPGRSFRILVMVSGATRPNSRSSSL